jgi:hypothetical protein
MEEQQSRWVNPLWYWVKAWDHIVLLNHNIVLISDTKNDLTVRTITSIRPKTVNSPLSFREVLTLRLISRIGIPVLSSEDLAISDVD